eukprot:gene5294-8081_t
MNPPRETVYVNNLPDKLKKDELKTDLYLLFSQYGPIVDIVAMKTPRTRGQAFIVYRETHQAAAALKALQGFSFFDKEIHLDFAKVKSDSVAKLDGTWRKRNVREAYKERLRKDKEFEKSQQAKKGKLGAGPGAVAKRDRDEGVQDARLLQPAEKKMKTDAGEPNSILFLMNFPQALLAHADALKVIFSPFPGFKEIRVPPPKPGSA